MDNRRKPKSIIGNKRPTNQVKTPSPSNQNKTVTQNKTINTDNSTLNVNRQRARRKKRIINNQTNTQATQRSSSNKTVNGQLKDKNLVSKTTSSEKSDVVVVKKKHPILTILLWILGIIIVLFASTVAYAKFSNLNPDLSGNIGLYNISSNAAAIASSNRIVNIAIFGVDGREDVEGERSDAIMIGSADFEHNKLKVTSLMRDTYVEMANEDYFDKLNAAYSIDGPLEAVKTINLNFDTAITDYVVFDFTALVAMVNAVGGIDINILDEDELYWLNQYLMDVNDKVGTNDPDVPDIGMQHLTGSQALSYARIRYVGNGDYERTQRQRNILEQVVAKAFAMNPVQQLNLFQEVLPYIQTSLRSSEIIKLGLNFLMMSDRTIEQSRLPLDEYASDGYLDGISYIFPNTLVDNIVAWYQFVYEIPYTPSATAQEISEEIEYTWW